MVVAIDRSAAAVRQAIRGSADELERGLVEFRLASVEEFSLADGESRFDLAFAFRVGALDGRHPELADAARAALAACLVPGGKVLIDGGHPLREFDLAPAGSPRPRG